MNRGWSTVAPVIGPLYGPASGSGVTWPRSCSHQPPASCDDCSGVRADEQEQWRARARERPVDRALTLRLLVANQLRKEEA